MGEARSSAELTVDDIRSQLSEEEREALLASSVPPAPPAVAAADAAAPHFTRALRSQEARINENFRFTVQGWSQRIHPIALRLRSPPDLQLTLF